MSVLTLVRHGQASYMSEDYDRLSPAGERQAKFLGDYWLENARRFDRVFCGPARRHRDTAAIVEACYRAAGEPWPHAEPVLAVDEFDAFQMMKRMLPVLIERDARVRALNQTFRSEEHGPEAGAHLQRLFEEVARHWCTGEFDVPELESWADFRARVQMGIDEIRGLTGRSARAVVFTSGGPIAAATGYALDLGAAQSLELLWMSRNCSYSEFLFSGSRFSLHSFNAIPHLAAPELITYR